MLWPAGPVTTELSHRAPTRPCVQDRLVLYGLRRGHSRLKAIGALPGGNAPRSQDRDENARYGSVTAVSVLTVEPVRTDDADPRRRGASDGQHSVEAIKETGPAGIHAQSVSERVGWAHVVVGAVPGRRASSLIGGLDRHRAGDDEKGAGRAAGDDGVRVVVLGAKQ